MLLYRLVAADKPALRDQQEGWQGFTGLRCGWLTHERAEGEKQIEKHYSIFDCWDFLFLDLYLHLCSTKLPFTHMYLNLSQSVLRRLVSRKTIFSQINIYMNSNIPSQALRNRKRISYKKKMSEKNRKEPKNR